MTQAKPGDRVRAKRLGWRGDMNFSDVDDLDPYDYPDDDVEGVLHIVTADGPFVDRHENYLVAGQVVDPDTIQTLSEARNEEEQMATRCGMPTLDGTPCQRFVAQGSVDCGVPNQHRPTRPMPVIPAGLLRPRRPAQLGEDVLVAHMPGKHNQSAHGRGAGYEIGNDVDSTQLDEMSSRWPEHLQTQYSQQTWARGEVARNVAGDDKWRQGRELAEQDFVNSIDGPISVQVTPSAVAGILRDERFKTQHEIRPKTQASGYKPNVRQAYEESFMGVPKDTAMEHKPVYGYVGESAAAKQYGSVRFELHDSTKERTTVTYGDSLNGTLVPMRIGDVKSASTARRLRAIEPGAMSSAGSHTSIGTGRKSGFADYTEAQVHGGIQLSDVKQVHMPKAVAAKYRKRLEKLNIEVIESD